MVPAGVAGLASMTLYSASQTASSADSFRAVISRYPTRCSTSAFVKDPLRLAPFSKEIEQAPHRDVTFEEILEEMARERAFGRGEF
jgi:hypothetical protein